MSYSSDKRRVNQEFKRRYSSMSPNERDDLDKDTNRVKYIVFLIVFIIIIIIFLITGEVIGE